MEASQGCFHGCFFSLPESKNTVSKSRTSTASESRQNFAVATTTSIFPNSEFTNHESLPSLQHSFTEFTKAYPQYFETDQIDHIRAEEYYHLSLSGYTCLDYIGTGLFSYSQLQKQESSIVPVSYSSSSPPQSINLPLFSVSYKTGDLKTQLLHGGQESELESAMKRRIMGFMNISQKDYCMVFTANKTSAFKLLAESYPFQTCLKLLTVYDYESEAVDAMVNCSQKRGARVMSAEFTWPRLRIHSAKLKKMIVSEKKNKKKRGLFVFPIHSRISGTRYPYLWMSMAQENGWHTLVDACALGPKDMDRFGLSLFSPDFLTCSFYKVFGENPSGFGCLFVKKSTIPILESSSSAGIVSLVQSCKLFQSLDVSSGTCSELAQSHKLGVQEKLHTSSSLSGPTSSIHGRPEKREITDTNVTGEQQGSEASANVRSGAADSDQTSESYSSEIECRGLDQVDSMGLTKISNRARYLINWLVNALMKLQHPNTRRLHLVRIYGPKVKFDRGPALAFNLHDWKGEKVEPALVQKLADRNNISLSRGFLHHIFFPDKYEEEKLRVLEQRESGANGNSTSKKHDKVDLGVSVVTAALGFLVNFEDVYRLWAFIAQFLDADFVEKERWRYTALNQKIIEI